MSKSTSTYQTLFENLYWFKRDFIKFLEVGARILSRYHKIPLILLTLWYVTVSLKLGGLEMWNLTQRSFNVLAWYVHQEMILIYTIYNLNLSFPPHFIYYIYLVRGLTCSKWLEIVETSEIQIPLNTSSIHFY